MVVGSIDRPPGQGPAGAVSGTEDTQRQRQRLAGVLGPMACVVLGATALTMAIIGMRWDLQPVAISAFIGFVICLYGYLACFMTRLPQPGLMGVCLAGAAFLSVAAVLAIPHGAQTEVVLVSSLLIISTAMVGLSLYFEPRAARGTQAILFIPTAAALLISGGAANLFLVGMMGLISALLLSMQNAFARIVQLYSDDTARYARLAESSLDDLEAVLRLLHPLTLRVTGDGDILDISPRLLDALATTPTALAGRSLFDLLDIGSQKTASQIISLRRLLSAQTAFETDEIGIVREDGHPLRYRLKAFPTSCGHTGSSVKVVFEPMLDTDLPEEDPLSVLSQIAGLSGLALWESGPDHELSRIIATDPDLEAALRSAFANHEEARPHVPAMAERRDLSLTLGLTANGAPVHTRAQPRFDTDGVFLGYRGVAQRGSMSAEAPPLPKKNLDHAFLPTP